MSQPVLVVLVAVWLALGGCQTTQPPPQPDTQKQAPKEPPGMPKLERY